MLKSWLKKLLIRFDLLQHYYFLRYGLKYKIKAAISPREEEFCTLSPPY